MKRIELESMVDLAYLASTSESAIQHYEDGEVNVYFLIGGTMEESFIYFVKHEGDDIKTRFINLDITKNRIVYSNLPFLDAKNKIIPIIEVKRMESITFH